jgi:hypothetical protein
MKIKKFTEQSDWEKYWKNQEIIPFKKLFIEDYFRLLPKQGKLIEIGGFPGKFAGYFSKHFDYKVTILDYIMVPDIVRKVERSYALNEGSIQTIKADFFEYKIREKYDIVTSFGFIEHFEDTTLVMRKHVELLNPGAVLLVTLPNFKGINGFVQKFFDSKNYALHNIRSMDIKRLKNIMHGLGLHGFAVEFHGKPTIWLETDAPVAPFIKNVLYFTAKLIKHIPFKNNRLLAPYIVITGIK